MTDETTAAIARSCAQRWSAAMCVPRAVEELLSARLIDTASVFGAGVLTGVLIDREGVRALRMVAASPIHDHDVTRARTVLDQIR